MRLARALVTGLATTGLLAPAVILANVDPDCFESEPFVCARDRVDETKIADRVAQPVLTKAGWAHGCYRVLIWAGDDGGPGTLLLVLSGPKGAPESWCQAPVVEGLTDQEALEIQKRGGGLREAMRAIAEKSRKKGKANSASLEQVQQIGAALRAAILATPSAVRARILRQTKTLMVANGYGAEWMQTLP